MACVGPLLIALALLGVLRDACAIDVNASDPCNAYQQRDVCHTHKGCTWCTSELTNGECWLEENAKALLYLYVCEGVERSQVQVQSTAEVVVTSEGETVRKQVRRHNHHRAQP
mmetsp:Transcript_22782/g.53170  ORF Transcript_22782/g.53170 Transcript_22782/m.53170 type:complete len:113 (-) Transcript_22782:293-631(-)